ncbi:Rv0361 family membrane protein [Nocardia tengchongensis]|uniref:Rv0361 family membrane protein n=1 Tax=Nocardia tengchongensis TaxID=2055889 RepID=UPI00368EAC51
MTRHRRTPITIGIGIAAAVLVGGGIATAMTLNGKDSGPSDDKRIETTLRDFYGTLATGGAAQAVGQTCASDRAQYDALPDAQKQAMNQGKVSMKIDAVQGITVTGERATAVTLGTLSLPGAPDSKRSTNEHLRKENGVWKVCSTDGK